MTASTDTNATTEQWWEVVFCMRFVLKLYTDVREEVTTSWEEKAFPITT
jgi:hypothetical protein